jgi:hypothetical protein
MMKGGGPSMFAKARSDYGAHQQQPKLIKQVDNFAKINLFSPAFSVYNKSLNQNSEEPPGDMRETFSG